MVKSRLSLFLLVLLSHISIYAQDVSYPEGVESEIRTYLDSLDANEYDATLIITHLLDDSQFDGETKGVYKFFTLTSHSKSFLLFFDGNRIEIIKEYDPTKILIQASKFIEKYHIDIKYLEKARYLEKIIEVIISNLDPPNMVPPPSREGGDG